MRLYIIPILDNPLKDYMIRFWINVTYSCTKGGENEHDCGLQ